jgi:hypothetical protein
MPAPQEGSMTKVKRFDRGEFRGDWACRTAEGYIRGEAVVTRSGVFTYQNADGTPRYELRHPDDVFAASHLDSLKMIPVLNGHPAVMLVTAETAKELSIGFLGENIRVDGALVIAPLVITTKDGVQAVDNGRQELSLGYEVDLIEEKGTYNGQPYDYRQTNIKDNHLAIVDKARAGSVARLNLDGHQLEPCSVGRAACDGHPGPCAGKQKRNDDQDTAGGNMVKVTVDGIQYDAAPEVARALEKLQTERDGLKGKLDALKEITLADGSKAQGDAKAAGAIEALKGERDQLKTQLDEAKKAAGPEKIGDAVKARVKLEKVAAAVLDGETLKKLDGMKDLEIQKAVILAAAPEASRADLTIKLDAATEAYVQARYDAAAEGLPARDPNAVANQRRASTDALDTAGSKVLDPDKARADYTERLENAWKEGDKK